MDGNRQHGCSRAPLHPPAVGRGQQPDFGSHPERDRRGDRVEGPGFFRPGWGVSLSPVESDKMFVFRLPERGQMFASERPSDAPALAWSFAIF
jgi:hypothetical protein